MLENSYGKAIWFPRVLAIAFSIVLVIFYFAPFATITRETFSLLTGILPAFTTLAFVILTWRKPKYCGYYLIIFAVAFACYFLFTKFSDSLAFAMMVGVPLIVGVQFIILGTKKPV